MVEQWQRLTDYLGAGTRRRFNWFVPGGEEATNPGPFGPRQVAGTYNPLYAPGDLLGVLGTARDAVSEYTLQPLLGAAMAQRDQQARGLGASLDNLGLRGKPIANLLLAGANPEAEQPRMEGGLEQVRQNLIDYGHQQAARAPLGEFGFGTATDPLSYFPTQTGTKLLIDIASHLPAASRVGQAASALAKVGPAYDEATGAALKKAGDVAQFVGKRTPVLKDLMDPSAMANTSSYVGRIGNALQTALKQGARGSRTMEKLMGMAPDNLPTDKAVWGHLRRRWDGLAGTINELDHPLKKLAATALWKDALDRKNWTEAETAVQIGQVQELLKDGEISPQEAAKYQAELYQIQSRRVAALQDSMTEAIGKLTEVDPRFLPEMEPEVADAIGKRVQSALTEMQDIQLTARDMSTGVSGAKATLSEEAIHGLLEGGDLAPLRHLTDDSFYRVARDQGQDALGRLADDAGTMLNDALPGLDTENLTQHVIDQAMGIYGAKADELMPHGFGWWERAGMIDPVKARTLADEKSMIGKAYRKVDLAKRRVITNATPILTRHYLEQGLTNVNRGVGDSVPEAVRYALSDSFTLKRILKEVEAARPGQATDIAPIREVLKKWDNAGGDLLQAEDGFHLTMYEIGKQKARINQIKPPPPWLAPYLLTTAIWRDTALTSGRYLGANAIFAVYAASRTGIPASKMMKNATLNLKDVAAQLGEYKRPDGTMEPVAWKAWAKNVWEGKEPVQRVTADSLPDYKAVGREDEEGNVILDYRLQRQIDSLSIHQGTEQTLVGKGSAVSQVPRGAWAAGIGTVSGTQTYLTAPEDMSEEDRRAAALKNAAVGAAAGAALPTVVWATRVLGKVIETTARTVAAHHGFGEGLETVAKDHILGDMPFLKTMEQPTVGSPLMVPGAPSPDPRQARAIYGPTVPPSGPGPLDDVPTVPAPPDLPSPRPGTGDLPPTTDLGMTPEERARVQLRLEAPPPAPAAPLFERPTPEAAPLAEAAPAAAPLSDETFLAEMERKYGADIDATAAAWREQTPRAIDPVVEAGLPAPTGPPPREAPTFAPGTPRTGATLSDHDRTYAILWREVQAGKTDVEGEPDHLLDIAKRLFDQGKITGPSDMEVLAEQWQHFGSRDALDPVPKASRNNLFDPGVIERAKKKIVAAFVPGTAPKPRPGETAEAAAARQAGGQVAPAPTPTAAAPEPEGPPDFGFPVDSPKLVALREAAEARPEYAAMRDIEEKKLTLESSPLGPKETQGQRTARLTRMEKAIVKAQIAYENTPEGKAWRDQHTTEWMQTNTARNDANQRKFKWEGQQERAARDAANWAKVQSGDVAEPGGFIPTDLKLARWLHEQGGIPDEATYRRFIKEYDDLRHAGMDRFLRRQAEEDLADRYIAAGATPVPPLAPEAAPAAPNLRQIAQAFEKDAHRAGNRDKLAGLDREQLRQVRQMLDEGKFSRRPSVQAKLDGEFTEAMYAAPEATVLPPVPTDDMWTQALRGSGILNGERSPMLEAAWPLVRDARIKDRADLEEFARRYAELPPSGEDHLDALNSLHIEYGYPGSQAVRDARAQEIMDAKAEFSRLTEARNGPGLPIPGAANAAAVTRTPAPNAGGPPTGGTGREIAIRQATDTRRPDQNEVVAQLRLARRHALAKSGAEHPAAPLFRTAVTKLEEVGDPAQFDADLADVRRLYGALPPELKLPGDIMWPRAGAAIAEAPMAEARPLPSRFPTQSAELKALLDKAEATPQYAAYQAAEEAARQFESTVPRGQAESFKQRQASRRRALAAAEKARLAYDATPERQAATALAVAEAQAQDRLYWEAKDRATAAATAPMAPAAPDLAALDAAVEALPEYAALRQAEAAYDDLLLGREKPRMPPGDARDAAIEAARVAADEAERTLMYTPQVQAAQAARGRPVAPGEPIYDDAPTPGGLPGEPEIPPGSPLADSAGHTWTPEEQARLWTTEEHEAALASGLTPEQIASMDVGVWRRAVAARADTPPLAPPSAPPAGPPPAPPGGGPPTPPGGAPPRAQGAPPPGSPKLPWGPARNLRDILGLTDTPGVRARVDPNAPTTVLSRTVPDEVEDAFRDFLARRRYRASPWEVEEFMTLRDVHPDHAKLYGQSWSHGLGLADNVGLDKTNAINFDYSDVSKLTQSLRDTGMFPFITFSVKAAPLMATILVQDPRWIMAIDRLNNLSEEDVREGGLSTGYERMARLGQLGDFLAQHLLGRPDATMLAQPWSLVMPYAEAGSSVSGSGPIDKALDFGRSIGLSPGPLPTLALQASGLSDYMDQGLFRTTPYLESLTGIASGQPQNIERGLSQVVRGARRAMGQEDPSTLTGSAFKDIAVQQRIAEMALEATGKPPAGVWKEALNDPTSEIYKAALAQVERQIGGQTLVSSIVPFKTRALSDTGARVAAARKAQGVDKRTLDALPDDAARSAAWKKAEARDRTTGTFSAIGRDWQKIAWAQKEAQMAYWKKTAKLAPSERSRLRNAYLRDKPELKRLLMEGQAAF